MDIKELRSDTPGCSWRIHVNNAGSSLMPNPVLQAVQEHLVLESQIGGYEAEAQANAVIEEAYLAVAELLAAHPRNIAFTENATVSYLQALSSIPFKQDDVILTTNNDYISNQIQFLALQSRYGVRIERAPDTQEGGVDVQLMGEMIRTHKPRIVCVTHIPTNSGLIQDVASIGKVCAEEEVPYLVDACQSVGQLPLDVTEIQCDFLSASARKFLRGPRGSGFLYVSDRVLELGYEPLFIDMRGAEWVEADTYRPVQDARRFENWEYAWPLVLGTGAAARYALNLGLGCRFGTVSN